MLHLFFTQFFDFILITQQQNYYMNAFFANFYFETEFENK